MSQRSPASLISLIPLGENRPFTWVLIPPLSLTRTISSPFLIDPLCRIRSRVFPRPLSSFISRTVASPDPSTSVNWSERYLSASPITTARRSWIPSPSLADIGTMAISLVKSLIFSYLSRLNPSSANWPTSSQYLWSKSPRDSLDCPLIEIAMDLPSSASHPWILSTLFAATTKGVLDCLRIRRDSLVCGLHPSIMSTIRIAMSAKEPPLERRDENEWCPGVSMNRSPGESNVLPPRRGAQSSFRTSEGTSVAPMC